MIDYPEQTPLMNGAFRRIVANALGSGQRRHRFEPVLEEAYQAYSSNVKYRHAMTATLVCLGIFNLGLIIDYAGRPDLFWQFFWLRSVFATLPCLLLVWFSCRLSVYWLRDWVAAASFAWVGLAVNILIAMRGANAVQTAFSVSLLIIFVNIIFHLRTRVAGVLSLVIGLTTVVFMRREMPVLHQPEILALVFLAATSIITLIANHRLEKTMRHLYLLILREQMRTRDMERENLALSTISFTDALTAIANRRRFEHEFDTACRLTRDTDSTTALLLIDVDRFKLYNDTHGHPAGDACLKHVAAVIARQVRREHDLPARLGGEEFAVLMRGADMEAAARVADAIHTALSDGWPHNVAPVTVSIGLAAMASARPEILMAAADKALYLAKQQGRNCTISNAAAA